MNNVLLRRFVAATTLCIFMVAVSGCTRHEVVLDPKGFAFAEDSRNTTIGHISSITKGFTALFVFPFMPGADADGNASNSLAYTYNKMAEEASKHGANKLLDLRSSKSSVGLFFIFVQLFQVEITANMTR
jgi:hypothetical protein